MDFADRSPKETDSRQLIELQRREMGYGAQPLRGEYHLCSGRFPSSDRTRGETSANSKLCLPGNWGFSRNTGVDYGEADYGGIGTQHNSLPSSSISPMYALGGRPNILDQMTHAAVLPARGDRYDCEERQMRNRMCAINVARNKILEMDAKRTLKLSLHRNSLIASSEHYREGDTVDIWIARKKKRQGSFRVLYDSGGTVIVENLGALFKHPKNWTRLRGRDEGIPTPDVIPTVVEKNGSSTDKRAASNDIPEDPSSVQSQEGEIECTAITVEFRRGSSPAKTKLQKKKVAIATEAKERSAKTTLHSAHVAANRLSPNYAQLAPSAYPQFISCLMAVRSNWGKLDLRQSTGKNDHWGKGMCPGLSRRNQYQTGK